MQEITRVGVDLSKHVIQVHAVDGSGKLVTSRALARDKFIAWCAQLPPGCLVAMEASSSAHLWARKLAALALAPRIIAAHLAAPYRLQGKGGKNDANDAAAICEAASRPTMRFVPVKSVEQQSMLCIHRLREGFKVERTACINRIRGLLAEFGVVFSQSPAVLRQALPDALEDATNELGGLARLALQRAWQHWQELGGITKRGDMYVRSLLIQGAKSAVMNAHKRNDPISQWALALRERSGWQKAVVALANKNARILWAVMTKGHAFDAKHVSIKPC